MNLTAWENMTDIGSMLSAPNQVTSGLWGYIIFGMIYAFLFIVFSAASNDEKKGLVSSSAIMTVVSILLVVLSPASPLIPAEVTVIPLAITVISAMVLRE